MWWTLRSELPLLTNPFKMTYKCNVTKQKVKNQDYPFKSGVWFCSFDVPFRHNFQSKLVQFQIHLFSICAQNLYYFCKQISISSVDWSFEVWVTVESTVICDRYIPLNTQLKNHSNSSVCHLWTKYMSVFGRASVLLSELFISFAYSYFINAKKCEFFQGFTVTAKVSDSLESNFDWSIKCFRVLIMLWIFWIS